MEKMMGNHFCLTRCKGTVISGIPTFLVLETPYSVWHTV